MKLVMLTSALLLVGTGTALAQTSANTMSAGRPSAILNDEQCQDVWSRAVTEGETLDEAGAGPFIVNFAQVDTDADGSISNDEFKAACGKGLVKFTDR
ncbi:hypothetical protein [Methyloceanibacter sp.]|uniref:hypothetical protein n=1 Tax=Methyloceanibacter sp. TaxID=1965321 RepID=UPI002BAA1E3E|nr:hypothetical protein [Methyloceanibacter sp.]HML90777.1 hypothetical protein [Methyloceanibacter sp.]